MRSSKLNYNQLKVQVLFCLKFSFLLVLIFLIADSIASCGFMTSAYVYILLL